MKSIKDCEGWKLKGEIFLYRIFFFLHRKLQKEELGVGGLKEAEQRM
jgi:hypothetical protein